MPDLTFAEVGQILRLIQAIDASDVDLEWGDLRLRIRHGEPTVTNGAASTVQEAKSVVPQLKTDAEEPAVTAAPQTEAATEAPQTAAVDEAPIVPDHWVAVAAPMVGTFYRSPKPGEPPYVEAGDVVAAGDTVGLVEVMKLFTELKTDVAGKVARIDAADSALVEFGQPLIWIEPA